MEQHQEVVVQALLDLFGSGKSLGWAQECARAVLIFAYGLLLVRIAGRRVFGKWSALDIIVSIVIGSNLSRALTGSAALFGTLAASTLMVGLHWLAAILAERSPALSHLFEGRAIALLSDGRVDERQLRRHAVSEADLGEALRKSGVESPSATRAIMLEPSGAITVLEKA